MKRTTNFQQFRLNDSIINALEDLNFKAPTEIQEKALPIILKGKSLIGQSQTGSGKTHAFLLPIFQKLKPSEECVQAVITAPTRELAEQINAAAKHIASFCEEEIDIRLYVGGTDRQRSLDKLSKRQPHIVIGTPGRIQDFVKENALFVHTTSTLVIDEADTMLDMGFLNEVDFFAGKMQKNLQMLVFSATIPEKLQPFLKKYMANPESIEIQSKQVSADTLENILIPIKTRHRADVIIEISKTINPYLTLIFVNTKKKANEVVYELSQRGFAVGKLHGDLPPRERKKMMKQILDLQFQYIVATDLAARGIDIPGVSHVINYELPTDLDFYIHRVGRAGRAGLKGTAISLYSNSDQDLIDRLEKRQISFLHFDVKNGGWIELPPRNKRRMRTKKGNELDINATKLVKKGTKVKPNHKKKRGREIEKMKKRLARHEKTRQNQKVKSK